MNYLNLLIKEEDDKVKYCKDVIDEIETYVSCNKDNLSENINYYLFCYQQPFNVYKEIKKYVKTTSVEYKTEWMPKITDFYNQYKRLMVLNHNFIENNKDKIITIIQNAIDTNNFNFKKLEKPVKNKKIKLTPEQLQANRKKSQQKYYNTNYKKPLQIEEENI